MNHKSHLGVYAVPLNSTGTHVLVIRKARGPYTGRYDLPGGSVEDGELIEETLQREVLEETGCTVETFTQIGAFSTLFDYTNAAKDAERLRHIGVLYDVTISGIPRTDGDWHDSHGCQWVKIVDVTKENSSPFLHIMAARQ